MSISVNIFGHQINWEDGKPTLEHALTFKRLVQVVSAGIFLKMMCPDWFLWAPTKGIRDARDAFVEFRVCPLRL